MIVDPNNKKPVLAPSLPIPGGPCYANQADVLAAPAQSGTAEVSVLWAARQSHLSAVLARCTAVSEEVSWTRVAKQKAYMHMPTTGNSRQEAFLDGTQGGSRRPLDSRARESPLLPCPLQRLPLLWPEPPPLTRLRLCSSRLTAASTAAGCPSSIPRRSQRSLQAAL